MCAGTASVPTAGIAWRRAERDSVERTSSATSSTANSSSSSGVGGRPSPRRRLSELASHLALLATDDSIQVCQDASLEDICDLALRALHVAAESNKPLTESLLAAVPDHDRRESVMWLLQAFDVMGYSEEAFFQAVLVQDRYYSREAPRPACHTDSHTKLLAAACLALKVGRKEDAAAPLQKVVAYLSRGQVPFGSVMVAEFAILRKLGFVIDTPTALDHIDALAVRPLTFDHRARSLASYLVQLSLAEAVFHYSYPQAVLAAAALVLALSTLDAPPEAHDVLLEDLALCGDELSSLLAPACSALHTLWLQSLSWSEAPIAKYAQCLREKFSRPVHFGVSGLPPPVLPVLLVDPAAAESSACAQMAWPEACSKVQDAALWPTRPQARQATLRL